MTKPRQFDLLSDLTKLLKKYGPQTFDDLAQQLADPRFMETFLYVLRTTANVYRSTKSTNKSSAHSKSSDFRASLIDVSRADAEKGALLTELYDALKAKMVLPTLREMQSFASDNGLDPITTTSRDKAIVPFVKRFLGMPIEDVRSYLSRIPQTQASYDRSLEGWSNIIFGNKQPGVQRHGEDSRFTETNADFERMAKHITNYIAGKHFSRVGFDRIRSNINPAYSDKLLFEMIDRFPDQFRRVTLKGDKPAVGLVSRELTAELN